eukprot:s1233_g8.t1
MFGSLAGDRAIVQYQGNTTQWGNAGAKVCRTEGQYSRPKYMDSNGSSGTQNGHPGHQALHQPRGLASGPPEMIVLLTIETLNGAFPESK